MTDLTDVQTIALLRKVGREQEAEIEELKVSNARKDEKLAAQSDTIIELLAKLSEHAPQTTISELVKQVALGTNHNGQVRGLALHIPAPIRKQELL